MSRTSSKFRRAYVGGTFDLFHAGHVNLLREAAALASEVVVSLNEDAFAARYKRRPVQSLEERRAVVDACRYVDRVVVNVGAEDSRPAIELVAPDVIVHGDDWVGDAYLAQLGVDDAWLRARRIAVAYVRYTPGISTSALIARSTVDA